MKLDYKPYPSKYELYYIKWNGIDFDRDKLISFIKRIKKLKYLSIFSKNKKEEMEILIEIYKSYDTIKLNNLLNNEENTSRICLIEKWARIGATDILINNVFSRQTYTTIINLPLKDYQLVMKRVEEIINTNKNITYQKDIISENMPGL